MPQYQHYLNPIERWYVVESNEINPSVFTLWTLLYFSSISAMGAFFLTDSIPALALSFDL
jgi:hypothetical protein